jgi:hypothetical protein
MTVKPGLWLYRSGVEAWEGVCRRSEAASLFCLAGGFTALRPSSRPLSESQIPTPPNEAAFQHTLLPQA